MILAIRTDQPTAELYLFDKKNKLDSYSWLAHRNLASEILEKIEYLLSKNDAKMQSLSGIIIFTGQGSFTGLRIGTTVANTLAYSYAIPIVSAQGDTWLDDGLSSIQSQKKSVYVLPEYSSEPNITKPKPKT